MAGHRFPEDPWEIATNPPPIWATPFWALFAANDATFSEPFPPHRRVAENGQKNEASLAAIWAQESGTVNPQ